MKLRLSSAARTSIYLIIGISLIATALLVGKSIMDFSHSGPQIKAEIMRAFLGYSIYALARLAFWAFMITAFIASAGAFAYHCIAAALRWRYRWFMALLSAGCAVGLVTFMQFANHLLYLPGGIVASFNYRASRLYALWEMLSPMRIAVLEWGVALLFIVPVAFALASFVRRGEWRRAAITGVMASAYGAIVFWAQWAPEPAAAHVAGAHPGRPNIVMIGSDTLRGDRLGVNGYSRPLTPNIDALAGKGINFSQYIVPVGRTAPSLASLLTGTWPHTHKIRDNYVSDKEAMLPVPALPQLLRQSGYRSAVVGDWAASDLGKLHLGFDYVDTSPDQWNLKYLLRQGPKDIQLYLALFTHNRFGKTCLPEIYYLAGVPLTPQVGKDARAMLKRLAGQGQPFFLDVFIASTHLPFSTTYPYYRLYADPHYRGESLFSMADVSSVEDVLKAQAAGKQNFDVRQIINLYDGAVKGFDDEVGKMLAYLKASGLDKNTIVVVYSDHGVDLFEGATWGQGNIVSDFGYRAPLVIYDPRRPPVGTVSRTVRSVDVAPTLLQLTGTPIPASMEGASLLPFFEHGNKEPDRIAFAETGIWIAKVPGLPKDRIPYPSILDLLEIRNKQTGTLSIKKEYQNVVVRAKSTLAREGRWALVYFPLQHGEQYTLYDLDTDLGMRHDVIQQHADIAAHLKEKLRAWMQADQGDAAPPVK